MLLIFDSLGQIGFHPLSDRWLSVLTEHNIPAATHWENNQVYYTKGEDLVPHTRFAINYRAFYYAHCSMCGCWLSTDTKKNPDLIQLATHNFMAKSSTHNVECALWGNEEEYCSTSIHKTVVKFLVCCYAAAVA